MDSREPVSLSRITTAFAETIEALEKLRDLSADEITERDRIVELLQSLLNILKVAAPCGGTFVPKWLKPK